MPVLTQRNASIVFGLSFAWTSVITVPGLIPDNPYTHGISALLMGASAFMGFQGFTRTPQGNTLPPAMVTEVDRSAVVAKAGDAILESKVQKVVEEATKPDTQK